MVLLQSRVSIVYLHEKKPLADETQLKYTFGISKLLELTDTANKFNK